VGLAIQVNWTSLPSFVGDLQLDTLLLRGFSFFVKKYKNNLMLD
jgi:hypothetical protein